MTTNPLMQHIEAIAKEKGIEPQVIIAALEDAMLTASRKHYKSTENLRTRLNPETGQIELFAVKHIVQAVENAAVEISLDEAQALYGDEAEIDMEIEFPKSTEGLGRIAAQTAKQVISQKVREAERDNVYEEYNQRIGEVMTATIKRFETGDIVAEIGRVEASLPRKEQSRAENYNVGDRVRAVIKAVNRNVKGPQIVLSRTDPALLIKLFEQEVPEIYDGTVMIRGAVREAGDRAKVAVYSRERDVDPVGACVGMKGTRVQAIIRELRGGKIDIKSEEEKRREVEAQFEGLELGSGDAGDAEATDEAQSADAQAEATGDAAVEASAAEASAGDDETPQDDAAADDAAEELAVQAEATDDDAAQARADEAVADEAPVAEPVPEHAR